MSTFGDNTFKEVIYETIRTEKEGREMSWGWVIKEILEVLAYIAQALL